jgi:glutamate---cysteine ligase / carboxylate-amine ligase
MRRRAKSATIWKLQLPPTPLAVMTKDRIIAMPGAVSGEEFNFIAASGASRSSRHRAGPRPRWAHWNDGLGRRYTLGVEEEVMLLHRTDHSLAESSESVLDRLSDNVRRHTFPETHAAVVELATGVHQDVSGAVTELAALRSMLAHELSEMGLDAAAAGTYPLSIPTQTRVTGAARYRKIADSMRALARREPTLALHVHVGIPDREDAVRVFNRLRRAVPLLLAMSANSPFSQGRDTGFASARTVVFQGFPRTGTARSFVDYDDYVDAVDVLIASQALPDPSFLWWDVRLQPGLGTVEVRVMDTQSTVAESAGLVALVQSLTRLELEGVPPRGDDIGPEALAENRFIAARDGSAARLINPARRTLVPVTELADATVAACRPHATELGCLTELERAKGLASENGADRQRARADSSGLAGLVSALVDGFPKTNRRRAEA